MISATRRDSSCASRCLALGAVLGDPLLDRRRGLADGQQLPGQPLARRLGGRQRQMRGIADLGDLLLDRLVDRLAERARGSPRPERATLSGITAAIASRAWLAAWFAASRTRTSASTSSGPVSRTSCAAAPSASPTAAPSARSLLLGLARAFAQRGEQGVERLALARDARLALRDARGGIVGRLLHRAPSSRPPPRPRRRCARPGSRSRPWPAASRRAAAR